MKRVITEMIGRAWALAKVEIAADVSAFLSIWYSLSYFARESDPALSSPATLAVTLLVGGSVFGIVQLTILKIRGMSFSDLVRRLEPT